MALLLTATSMLSWPALAQTASDQGGAVDQTAAPTDPAAPPEPGAAATPAGADLPTDAGRTDIVVTGSRLASSTYQSPTPVTTVTPAQIEARAPVSLVDVLQDIPTVRPNMNSSSSTNIGVATFDMRSLGPTRTLTMIDGRRVTDSNPVVSPVFDINLIPTALIRTMDVVTAGASSVYGSDAITGVVNIIMDSRMTGLKLDGQYGISDEGDNRSVSANAGWGTSFADGNGHLVVAASYFDRPDILYQRSRDWGRTGYTLLSNPAYTATNGQFRQVIVPGAVLSRTTDGGLILNGQRSTTVNGVTTTASVPWTFNNTQFGASGAQSRFVTGAFAGATWMQGGSGQLTQPDYGIIMPSNRRISGFSRASYDLAPSIEAFAEVLYARTNGHWTNTVNYDSGAIVFRQDNAYLPDNILASMRENNITQFTYGRNNVELGRVNNYSKNTYFRPVIGIKGKIDDRWNFDLSAVYTRLTYLARVTNNRNDPLWRLSVDAVRNPAVGGLPGVAAGTPVCRSTIANPTNGCVPVNLFGENTITSQAIAYFGGESFNRTVGHGIDVIGNFGGKLFEGWAGPIAASIGGEYRREDLNLTTDPVSATNSWRQASSGPYRGEISVREIYGEAAIPLLRDVPLVQNAEVSLAGRIAKYSTVGTARVYKIGVNWTVNDSIRLRGTYSKDFRGPKLNELFAAPFEVQGNTVIDNRDNRQVPIRTVTGGNPNLSPETAYTKTFGAVFQPTFLPRFRFSIDYFDIKLDDAIVTIGAQEVVDRCAQGAQDFCAGITRDAAGAIFRVNTVAYNATYLKTNGIDFTTSYDLRLGSETMLRLSANATWTDKLQTLANGVLVDRAGQISFANSAVATPHWRGAGQIALEKGPALVTLLGNFVGKGKYDTTYGALDLNRNNYPAYFYLGGNVSYDVTEAVNFFFKVDNILDTDPPFLSNSVIIRAQAAGPFGYHDQLGRSFTIGARVRM